jgi:hypothetical protein
VVGDHRHNDLATGMVRRTGFATLPSAVAGTVPETPHNVCADARPAVYAKQASLLAQILLIGWAWYEQEACAISESCSTMVPRLPLSRHREQDKGDQNGEYRYVGAQQRKQTVREGWVRSTCASACPGCNVLYAIVVDGTVEDGYNPRLWGEPVVYGTS